MNFKLIGKHEVDKRAMRDSFANTMEQMMETDKDIAYIDADLMNCINTGKLWKKYPERVFNGGIAEANCMGIAAGLSATGKKAYMHSFGCFASRRAMDQAFMSVAYAKLNVRVIGSDPGVTAAYNGGTHMPFEDMAVYLSIPEATVLEPSDYAQFVSVLRQVNEMHGLFYIRMVRKNFVTVYEDGSEFTVGKGVTVKDGKDVTIIASGIMVDEALKAEEILASEGISARIVDMFTWKPIDEELIIKCAKETGAIVTAENHNCTCGLGSAVARVVTENAPVPMAIVGVHDEFGQVGPEKYLRETYKLTAEEIVANVKKVLARK